jgi:hypothetical protein
MKVASVLTVISSLLLAAGCATPGVHEADRGLEGTLRSEINERHVDIDVHHGIVKLEGHVRTEADRQRIEALVRNTSGVVAVKDEIKVTFPTPGGYGAYPSSIPVYAGETTAPAPPVTVLAPPTPVVIPGYPRLTVQAGTAEDQPAANRIAEQVRAAALPMAGDEHVTITVTNGRVSLQGVVATQQEHGALIAAVQQAGGVTAIYDRLRVG